jgi:hypothetical protein
VHLNGSTKTEPVEVEPNSAVTTVGMDASAVEMQLRFAAMAAVDEFFDSATGAEISARIPAEKRAEVLAAATSGKVGDESEQRSAALSRLLERVEVDEFLAIAPPHLRLGLKKYALGLHGLKRSDQITKILVRALGSRSPAEQITALAKINELLTADGFTAADLHARVPRAKKT